MKRAHVIISSVTAIYAKHFLKSQRGQKNDFRSQKYRSSREACLRKNHSALQDDDFALGLGFQEGAQWADKNPKAKWDFSLLMVRDENVKLKAMLDVCEKALSAIDMSNSFYETKQCDLARAALAKTREMK